MSVVHDMYIRNMIYSFGTKRAYSCSLRKDIFKQKFPEGVAPYTEELKGMADLVGLENYKEVGEFECFPLSFVDMYTELISSTRKLIAHYTSGDSGDGFNIDISALAMQVQSGEKIDLSRAGKYIKVVDSGDFNRYKYDDSEGVVCVRLSEGEDSFEAIVDVTNELLYRSIGSGAEVRLFHTLNSQVGLDKFVKLCSLDSTHRYVLELAEYMGISIAEMCTNMFNNDLLISTSTVVSAISLSDKGLIDRFLICHLDDTEFEYTVSTSSEVLNRMIDSGTLGKVELTGAGLMVGEYSLDDYIKKVFTWT